MNSLLEEILPLFDFSTGNSFNIEVIKAANFVLSHLGCCSDRKLGSSWALPQTPIGWFTVPPTTLREFYYVKILTVFNGLSPSKVQDLLKALKYAFAPSLTGFSVTHVEQE